MLARTALTGFALLTSLSMCTLARSHRATPPPAPDEPVASGAMPATPPLVADAGAAIRPACTFGPTLALADPGERMLGAWHEPEARTLIATYTPRHTLALYAFDPQTGARSLEEQVDLPSGVEPLLAWRTAAPDVVVAWRDAHGIHAGRLHDHALVEFELSRAGTPDLDTAIAPLDDPSASQLIGVVSADRRTRTGTLCLTETTRDPRMDTCSEQWDASADLRRAGTIVRGSTRMLAQPETIPHGDRPAIARSDYFGWRTLLPLGARQGASGLETRVARAEPTRGGPMMAAGADNAVIAWVDPRGALELQSVDLDGVVRGEPVSLPLIDPVLEDMSLIAGAVYATVSTRADRAAEPMTTTVLRVDPHVASSVPMVSVPQRLALSRARMLPVGDGRVLFLSAGDRQGLVARCDAGS